MAEVIAIVASVVSIVQLADRVIELCRIYIETAHDASSDLRLLLLETSTTKAILENLAPLISSSSEGTSILERLSGPDSPIQTCHTIMTKIEALFPSGYQQGHDNTSKRQKVKASLANIAWTFKVDKAKNLVRELSNVKATIYLALTVQTTHDARDIKDQTRAIRTIVSDTQRDKIYEWLQITDPSPLHHQACSQYEPKTGDWMLRSPEWTGWLRATTPCIWIHGVPGAGKTILASYLIKAVKDHLQHNEATPCLRWTVNQLCRQAKSIPTCLNEVYEQGGTPSLKDLLGVIEAIVEDFDKIYIVIDAIDESPEPRDELLNVLQDLASDPRFEKIKLLATSREYNDIEKTMGPISASISMMNPLLGEDIRLYTRSKLSSNHKFKHWPPDLLAVVLEALSTNAKGMFRWVVCQIHTLERLKPEHDIVTHALANLPKTLNETYERIFEAIPEEDRFVVQFALKWIFYHQHLYERDISVPILLEAIERSISDLTASKHHYFLDEDRLRDICDCLITVIPVWDDFSELRSEFRKVYFAHFTVWEFISSMKVVKPQTTFFSVREKSTIMELTRLLICEALKNKADKLLRGSDADIEKGIHVHFDIYCAVSSVYSLSFLGPEVSEQDDLRSIAFDLLDHSQCHFASIFKVALANVDYILTTMNPDKFDYFLYKFLSVEWSPSSECTPASLLVQLLITDQTCELGKYFIKHNDEQELSQTQLEIQKIRFLERSGTSYKFRGSIIELFAQLSGSFPAQFRFLLEIGGNYSDPSMVLYSYLGTFVSNYKPPKDTLPKILQLIADVDSSRYVVSPLQIATQTCNWHAVLALLEAGANPKYNGNSDGMRWEDGTLLSQFNSLVGLSPRDIYLRLPDQNKAPDWEDKDGDEISFNVEISRREHSSFPDQRNNTKWITTLSTAPESQTSHPPHPLVRFFSPPVQERPKLTQTDRLPTISAAQALTDLNTSPTRYISTGLRDLDALLQNRDPGSVLESDAFFGGVSRGKVTEVWGPPGVGKTALGVQLASSALHAGDGVVWVDASHPVPGPRFSQILTSFTPTTPQSKDPASSPPISHTLSDLMENLTHFSTPTLAHLIALLTHPTLVFPPPRTSLIIIDSFSTLISNAYPRSVDSTTTPKKPGAVNPSSRKFPMLQYLINSFQKLAATRNIAIVILSQCVTKMRPGAGAVLVPAINTTAWEQGLGFRISIFRDWGWRDEDGSEVHDVRLAEVMKAEGISLAGGRRRLVGFTIGEVCIDRALPRIDVDRVLADFEQTGLQSLILPTVPAQLQDPVTRYAHLNQEPLGAPSLPLPQKRKLAATDLEIPDSDAEDDEDYGWAEEDEEDIPPPPPQWQGSEDILVPPPGELEGEDESDEGDEGFEEGGDGQHEKADDNGGRKPSFRTEVVDDSEDELAL
ncbi:rad55 [Hyphodiscus hymeniophilus]|uniref:Rad55 n=1 Tax=Hyphodiscus hymeniophilus TaxID=353542 RepID=A0A9P6VJM8_9HELO|nr:rad55 [Hyphodiscus hymeniophilus]